MLAASALLVKSGTLLVSHKFYQLFCNCTMLSQPSLQCTSGPPSYLNSTGGTSKEIVNLNSAFEKADRLLEQKRTGSQYEKIEQLHN